MISADQRGKNTELNLLHVVHHIGEHLIIETYVFAT
jgi:hypothetical protein